MASHQVAETPAPVLVHFTSLMNSELRKSLKIRATMEGITMEEALHQILCGELERLDQIHMTPEALRPGK